MTPDKLKQSIVDIIKDQQAPLTYERMFPEYQEWVDALLYLFNSEITRKSEELLDELQTLVMTEQSMYMEPKFKMPGFRPDFTDGVSQGHNNANAKIGQFIHQKRIELAKRASLPPKPERSEV